MTWNKKLGFITGSLPLFSGEGGSNSPAADAAAEKAKVAQAIHDCIEWPYPEKSLERLYSAIAKDPSFFIFHPDSKSTIMGFDAFQNLVENVFMKPGFKPTGSDIRELRVNLSRSGDVAWFSAILDDFGKDNGKPYAWLNTRWTGVLEKREGKWLIVQMHFSFASDAQSEENA
ncbi:MAG: nuclear transport factor 2 family protein [Candidatus Zixiibacteriota bacterium]|nr:MAG: nuclear transport factor 2 family protein [candidate division Zixibacteria bacterium]